MRKVTTRIQLLTLSVSLLIVLALSSTAKAQVVGSAGTSQGSQAAEDCGRTIEECGQRLDKALDAYEHALSAVTFARDEIQSRIALDKLKDEYIALKDEIIRVKDVVIAEQDKLIKRLQKPGGGFMNRLKDLLKTAERIALVGVGIYLGGR